MADFLPAYEAMIRNEGGYVLHDVPGDRGGMTYAGIARNMNPQWPGWAYDPVRDAFIPPKPSNDAVLDEETCQWIVTDSIGADSVADSVS